MNRAIIAAMGATVATALIVVLLLTGGKGGGMGAIGAGAVSGSGAIGSGAIGAGGIGPGGIVASGFSGGVLTSETTFNAPITYGCEVLTYAATVNIDFSTKPCKTLTLAGNITLTTSNIATGRDVEVVITGDGTARTFAPPAGWKFTHGNQPAKVGPNERVIIHLFPLSTTDASISADLGTMPATGLHGWMESPTGMIINAGTGNLASSTNSKCGFGDAHDGSTPQDGCFFSPGLGSASLFAIGGGTSPSVNLGIGSTVGDVNLFDNSFSMGTGANSVPPSSAIHGAFHMDGNGFLIYGKGGSASTTAPAMYLVDGGASTSRYFDFTGPPHAATEKFVEFRNDLYSGAQEFWKLYGHGVWTNPTTTNGSVQTATCAVGVVTVDLQSPIINIVDGAAACVVTISGTSFGSGGVNEDADFLLVVSDAPTGANKVTFAGATSLIPTSCSTTGLNKQGGTARVHYSKVIGKFIFETCQDIV